MPQFEAEGSNLWHWMLGLVMLALVTWVAAQLSGSDRMHTDQRPESVAPGAVEAPVLAEPLAADPLAAESVTAEPVAGEPFVTGAALQAWVRDSAAIGERMGDHDYIEAGLQRLTSAVQWLADRSSDTRLRRNAVSIAAAADRVATGPAYARDVQAVLVDAASLVAAMNERIGPHAGVERNVSAALDIAGSLDVDAALDRQRHRVFSYLDFMAEAITVAGTVADATRP